jgi:uncharacterized lipoprotein YddW (UPF0748 family)
MKYYILVALFFWASAISSQPKTEVRAVWLTTVWNIDWPWTSGQTAQKQEMINLLDELKAANFNTIMFQVRARGDLLYPSAIEPWGKSITGTLGSNPGWDVLDFVIEQAHLRGIEVHAWFVTYRVWDSSTMPASTSPQHVLLSHPTYCKSYVEGTSTSWWLDPGIPAVRTYLRSIITEMVTNYELDGIHFDYIRYPDVSFDDNDTYATYGGGMNKDDWRRNNITQFVTEAYNDIQAIKPMLKVGSAPIGIYKNIPGQGYNWEAYYDVYQASRVWLQNGVHDYLSPQIYWDIATTPQFHVVLQDWMNERYGRHIYAGIAAYRMGSTKSRFANADTQDFFYRVLNDKAGWTSAEILNQVDTTRAKGAFGEVYFSCNDITENVNSIYTLLQQGQYAYPANIPPMAWQDNIAPNPPQNLTITPVTGNQFTLRWNRPALPSDNDTVKYYNVYMSEFFPVEISDIKNVVAFQVYDTTVVVDTDTSGNRYFCVTAYDKGYNESTESNTVGSVTSIDAIAPATQLSYTGNWQTTDFNVSFADTDSGGSGLAASYYQICYDDGNEWRASGVNGFYYDDYTTAIHPEWGISQGIWSVNSQSLNQTDEANANTNIYTAVTQQHGNIYLYSWRMNIGGTGTNLRAGIHIFSDAPSESDRKNSYMVYFRCDGNTTMANTCQIYQYENNVFVGGTYLKQVTCPYLRNTWYQITLIYNSQTGYLEVYKDNDLVTTYTFANPFTFDAVGISFRTGNANVLFDDLKVMRKRGLTSTVTVGTGEEVPYCNEDPASPSCRINSLLVDSAGNWSAIFSEEINIDFTPPSLPVLVYDSIGLDIQTSWENETLSASWSQCSDTNSHVQEYRYCLGTSPGLDNAVPWTVTADTFVVYNGFVPVVSETYYTSVKAVNYAGLESAVVTSDGVVIETYVDVREIMSESISIRPNPANDFVMIETGTDATISITDMSGRTVVVLSGRTVSVNTGGFPEGLYLIRVSTGRGVTFSKLSIKH